MFADLDLLQQEKAMRMAEIYSDINHTDKETIAQVQSFMAQASCPPCGCIVDGFKKMSGQMKYKLHLCHGMVADHEPFF